MAKVTNELLVMSRLERQLSALDDSTRFRVLTWLADRFAHAEPVKQEPATACRAVPLGPVKQNGGTP